MTATINYDRPVANYIDALSATGHVNHSSWRKTSVTLHHNAGNLSFAGILNVWKTRPASAHFQVVTDGRVGQYVKVDEYAWATGSTEGNRSSISIEMANSTLSPDWQVAETTWKSAARLAGWLFANVIGTRPTSGNLFYHKHWYPTSCAGPYMDKVYGLVLAEAQRAYDSFRVAGSGGGGTSGPVTGGGSTPIQQEDDMFSDADRELLQYISAQAKAVAQLNIDLYQREAARDAADKAALLEVIKSLSTGAPVDLDAVSKAAEAGAQKALDTAKVTVNFGTEAGA